MLSNENLVTLCLAMLAAAASWGAHRQRIANLESEVRDLKHADQSHAASAVVIAELKVEVKHLRELIEALRDELRLRHVGAAE